MSHPMAMAVCIGMDAFRICIGISPKKYSMEEIIAWMSAMKEVTSTQEKSE